MYQPSRHVAIQPLLWVLLFALALILLLSPPTDLSLTALATAH
jgi:hypothetical protein